MVDFLDEIMADTVDDDETKNNINSNEDLSTLKAEIEALQKEKHGLLKNVKGERQKRQEISGRLNQLTETVNSILTNKEAANTAEFLTDEEDQKLTVKWTEDGEGFVNTDKVEDKLEDMLAPYQQKIQELELLIQNSNARQIAQTEADRTKMSIVGEDERYSEAFGKYQAARAWVQSKVVDFAAANNLNQALTSGEALDYVFDEEMEGEFTQHFPGVSLDEVVTAEDSKRHFRRTLKNMADAMTPNEMNPNANRDDRFQRVLRKPTTPGVTPNAKAGKLSVMDKINDISPQDLLNLTDAQEKALLRALAAEEKNDGISF